MAASPPVRRRLSQTFPPTEHSATLPEKSSPGRILTRLKPTPFARSLIAQSILSAVQPNQSNLEVGDEASLPVHHNWLYRRVALPVLALLRMGASPERLAWSIAVGLLVGVNPILGSTTLLCLVVAFVLRLNIAASQLGNHVVYPLELVLIIPFIRLASRVFHTAPMPLSANELLHAAREHPLDLSRQLWLWEWHAFVLWGLFAMIAVPVIALALTPFLRRLLKRVEHHQYPLLSAATQSKKIIR